MNEKLLEKFKNLSQKIIEEKGSLNLLMLIANKKSSTDNRWDLVISGKWLNSNKVKDFKYLLDETEKVGIDLIDQAYINRFVLLEPKNPFVLTINNFFSTINSILRINNCTFNNIKIEEAIIITSSKK